MFLYIYPLPPTPLYYYKNILFNAAIVLRFHFTTIYLRIHARAVKQLCNSSETNKFEIRNNIIVLGHTAHTHTHMYICIHTKYNIIYDMYVYIVNMKRNGVNVCRIRPFSIVCCNVTIVNRNFGRALSRGPRPRGTRPNKSGIPKRRDGAGENGDTGVKRDNCLARN